MNLAFRKFFLLIVAAAQIGVPALAVDDGRTKSGDEVAVEDVPSSLPKAYFASQPAQVEMGGFVFDNLHGKGPERDDAAIVAKAREMERDTEPVKVKARRKSKFAASKDLARQIASTPSKGAKKATRRKASTYEMRVKAQFWSPVSLAGIFLISDAHAARDFGIPQSEVDIIRSQGRQRLGRDLTDDEVQAIIAVAPKAAQGGSGAGGSGSGGGGVSETLFGVAALIAATSPSVMAAIQANADKSIAKTNADAQVAMTAISSDTSKYLADSQAEVAITQTLVAKDINKNNQDATTDRLSMQLSALADARQSANELDMMKTRAQFQLDLLKIQLAKEQSDATIQLAQMQFRLQQSIAGMAGGGAQSSLTVTRRNSTPTFYSGNFSKARTVTTAGTNQASGKLLANANTSKATVRPASSTSRKAVVSESAPQTPALKVSNATPASSPWDAAYNARVQRGLASEVKIPPVRRNMTPLAGDAELSEAPSVITPGSSHRRPGASILDAGLQ